MLPPQAPSWSARAARLRAAVACAAWLAGTALPGAALALDGRVDIRTTHQEGRSGDQTIESDDRRELYSLEEMRELWGRSTFQLQYLARRDYLSGTAAGATVDNRLVVQTPSASLSWHAAGVRANLYGRANRADQEVAGAPSLRDDSLEYGLWSTARRGPFDLDLNWNHGTSWRRGVDADRENRETVGSASARWQATAHDNLQARLSQVDLRSVTTGLRTSFTTTQFTYQGDRGFADGRGRAAWTMLHSRFRQRDRFDGTSGLQYVLPTAGGFWIDDTPSLLDPLEAQPEAVSALYDNDRTALTVINLGDNAVRGRDYGGDYRNIYLDFGEPVAMDAAFLYVDRRLTFIADIVQWDLYVNDDAENSDWGQPLPPGAWSARYVELETGDQGWEITFPATLTHRRLKLVDRKLGPTMGDLFVTEFEVRQAVTDTPPESRQEQNRTLLQGELDYRPHARLQLRFNTMLDRRTQSGDGGTLDRRNHGAVANWRLGTWLASAQAQWADEESPSGYGSDSNSQMLALTRQAIGRLSARLAWSRVADDNYDARYTTESVAADATWRAAPALAFSQRVTRGWRTSESGFSDSDSWVMTSEVRSAPRPGLRLDISRANRWVGREAGPGFTSYNTTQIDAHWEIAPLLTVWSQYTSQDRDRRDWTLRHSASWTPLQGGSVLLSLQANDYQDSRIDQLRRGGGATVDWQARPRLFLSASVEKHYEKLEGRTSRPLSFQARGYWTF
jgi:hypothetical protein